MKTFLSAAVSIALLLSATQAMAQDKKQLAFVVNAASDFWKLAEAGVKKAQAELPNYELQFKYPAQGTAALQNALMDDLVAAGTDAIMISSVDPKTSIDAFNRIAGQVPLFTTDSDAPDSNRIAYLGSSNTLAGVQAGEVAVKALPGGAKCMGFVGFLGADNAKERIAGFRQAVEGKGIELVDVRGALEDRAALTFALHVSPHPSLPVGARLELGVDVWTAHVRAVLVLPAFDAP